jgi:hypothetical protein
MPLCYKDRSYCSRECLNQGCRERVTEELRREAEAFGLPLCVADFRRPDCGYLPPEGEGAAE